MLTYKKISEAAEEAYKKGELFEFLTGRNGYDYPCPDVQVNIPTDWTRVIPGGIYNLYNHVKEQSIINQYEAAIRKALNGNMKDLWSAAYILFVQKGNEKRKCSPFLINQKLFNELANKVLVNKEELEKYFPYGKGDWDMFGDICRLNRVFTKKWGEPFFLMDEGGNHG